MMTWAVPVLVLAPALYLLSVAPLHYATIRPAPPGVALDPFEPPPAAVMAYGKPYDWLLANSPLRPFLLRYDEWCYHTISDWRMQGP